MSSLTLSKYAEEVESDDTPPLGRILWYTVRDCRVDHRIVLQLLHDNGLGSLLVPPYPKDGDTFKRITSAAKLLKEPIPDRAGVYENYLVRDVDGRGGESILRQIVCEQVDASGRKLNYEPIMDVEFFRKTGMIRTQMLPAVQDVHKRTVVIKMAQEIKNEYQSWRGKLGSYAVREFMRRVILDMGGTCVRPSGGVYFVREEHAEKIKALQKFTEGIPGGSEMVLVPLPDKSEQRSMLKRAFQAETTGAIDAAMTEIMKIRKEAKEKGKTISPAVADKFMAQFASLISNTKDYSGMLEDELHEIKTKIPVFQRQVLELSAAAKR